MFSTKLLQLSDGLWPFQRHSTLEARECPIGSMMLAVWLLLALIAAVQAALLEKHSFAAPFMVHGEKYSFVRSVIKSLRAGHAAAAVAALTRRLIGSTSNHAPSDAVLTPQTFVCTCQWAIWLNLRVCAQIIEVHDSYRTGTWAALSLLSRALCGSRQTG